MADSDITSRYAVAFAGLTPETMDDLIATLSPQVRFGSVQRGGRT